MMIHFVIHLHGRQSLYSYYLYIHQEMYMILVCYFSGTSLYLMCCAYTKKAYGLVKLNSSVNQFLWFGIFQILDPTCPCTLIIGYFGICNCVGKFWMNYIWRMLKYSCVSDKGTLSIYHNDVCCLRDAKRQLLVMLPCNWFLSKT